jgi:hypothetical protein
MSTSATKTAVMNEMKNAVEVEAEAEAAGGRGSLQFWRLL